MSKLPQSLNYIEKNEIVHFKICVSNEEISIVELLIINKYCNSGT